MIFYLADYRFTDSAQDYILDEWKEVDLTPLVGLGVQKLAFRLKSSDNSVFGMNTPAFLAIDNLELEVAPPPVDFDSMVVFGDSLSDTGNFKDLNPQVWGNPIINRFFETGPGRDLSDYDEGRFTSGFSSSPPSPNHSGVWHEVLAQRLGVSAAAYSRSGGNNYAYGGASTQSGTGVTSWVGDFDNIGKQVSDYLAANQGGIPDDVLFTLWGGGNDFFDVVDRTIRDIIDDNQVGRLSPLEALQSMEDSIRITMQAAVGNLKTWATLLSDNGADTIVVPNLPPMELVPWADRKAEQWEDVLLGPGYPGFGDELLTVFKDESENYNTLLAQTLGGLSLSANIVQLDVHSEFLEVTENPSQYGFINVDDFNSGSSFNPDEYLFWDEIHPTSAAHTILGDFAYEELQSSLSGDGGGGGFGSQGDDDPPEVPESTTCTLAFLTLSLVFTRRR